MFPGSLLCDLLTTQVNVPDLFRASSVWSGPVPRGLTPWEANPELLAASDSDLDSGPVVQGGGAREKIATPAPLQTEQLQTLLYYLNLLNNSSLGSRVVVCKTTFCKPMPQSLLKPDSYVESSKEHRIHSAHLGSTSESTGTCPVASSSNAH